MFAILILVPSCAVNGSLMVNNSLNHVHWSGTIRKEVAFTGHTQLWPKKRVVFFFFGLGRLEIKQNNNYLEWNMSDSFSQQSHCLSSWKHIQHLALNSWSVFTRLINTTNTITINTMTHHCIFTLQIISTHQSKNRSF